MNIDSRGYDGVAPRIVFGVHDASGKRISEVWDVRKNAKAMSFHRPNKNNHEAAMCVA